MYERELNTLKRYFPRKRMANTTFSKSFNVSAMFKRSSNEDPLTTIKEVCTCSRNECNTNGLGIETSTVPTSSTKMDVVVDGVDGDGEDEYTEEDNESMNSSSIRSYALNVMTFVLIIFRQF